MNSSERAVALCVALAVGTAALTGCDAQTPNALPKFAEQYIGTVSATCGEAPDETHLTATFDTNTGGALTAEVRPSQSMYGTWAVDGEKQKIPPERTTTWQLDGKKHEVTFSVSGGNVQKCDMSISAQRDAAAEKKETTPDQVGCFDARGRWRGTVGARVGSDIDSLDITFSRPGGVISEVVTQDGQALTLDKKAAAVNATRSDAVKAHEAKQTRVAWDSVLPLAKVIILTTVKGKPVQLCVAKDLHAVPYLS